jgi:oligopeptide transport system substrate-binding protein
MFVFMRWIIRLLLLAALVMGVMWFHHVRTHRPSRVEEATKAGILLLGNGSEPATLDPHLASGQPEHLIFHSIFEGLVAPGTDDPDADGPGAAVSWTQENFTTWTFKLQPKGKWSDGTPLTAHDFAHAYQRILTAKLGADYANMLYPLLNAEEYHTGKISDFSQVGVKVIDDYTLRLTLKGPAPYLSSMLKHYSWFPVPNTPSSSTARWTSETPNGHAPATSWAMEPSNSKAGG